ncbi:sensor histidine kinase [Sphingomonas sp.]|uniref:sensor histidine kinase n=1 Tax=Sphingomonas sp. TaxID=28214 RepID=UPI003B007AE3
MPNRPLLMSERRFDRTVLMLVVLGFVALLGAGGIAAYSVMRTAEHAGWVEHTYQVEGDIARFRLLIERLEVQRRGFLLTGGDRFARNFVATAREEPAALAAIRFATRDNPRQQARLTTLERIGARQLRLLGSSIAARARGGHAALEADGSVDLTRALRRYSEAMIVEERGLLAQRISAQRASSRVVFAMLILCGALIAAVAVMSVLIIRRYTHDLLSSREALRGLNETLEEHVAERTRDLSRANEEIQRFAYIVSHDLRSPLVNVMGFTGELEAATKPLAALVDAAEAQAPAILTEDARLAAREDLPESIRFIRTSTQKMDRLINAILKLSREGKRVLAPEPLDLVAIVDGIVASLRHLIDENGTEVTVDRAMPPLVADRLAVEQLLSNLIENALKYLKPGRPGRIVISARETGTRIDLAVSDNGRGIDPRDHDRIFDLFRRSGTQDKPGEGIGLAHVRALAYRMGGLVDCRSALDAGATFTLSLPSTPNDNRGTTS